MVLWFSAVKADSCVWISGGKKNSRYFFWAVEWMWCNITTSGFLSTPQRTRLPITPLILKHLRRHKNPEAAAGVESTLVRRLQRHSESFDFWGESTRKAQYIQVQTQSLSPSTSISSGRKNFCTARALCERKYCTVGIQICPRWRGNKENNLPQKRLCKKSRETAHWLILHKSSDDCTNGIQTTENETIGVRVCL